MKNVLIYGASGHSKMIIDILIKNEKYNIIGLIDSYKPINTDVYGYKILGDLELLPSLLKKHNVYGMIIGIGDNNARYNAYKNIVSIAPNVEFIPVVHPSAILAKDIIIPKGAVIMAGAIINANSKLGDFCVLNTKSSLGHDSIMANFSSLASGVTTGGNVQIGVSSAICISATIIQNVTIGDYTIVGAGSLVLKSIGDYKQAIGVPIHTITNRESDSKYLG